MFYVYRNTTQKSEAIAHFTDSDSALAYMEFKVYRDNDPQLTGYSVRDYALKTYAEIEK
jgi:hypothetical protein